MALKPATLTSLKHVTIGNGASLAAGSAVYVNGGTVALQNSIVAAHAQGVVQAAGAVNADYNLYSGNGVNVQGTSIANRHPFGGSPGFVDPVNDNYHLGLGSAAIDAGPSVGVTFDFDGDPRPNGTAFDLGYDESAASVASAQRTFVASSGSDGSPACGASAPCRTLSVALARTLAGGEVIVLDSASYDVVTITRPVSILAAAGIYAGISAAPGQSAIAVAAAPADNVILRGLTITSEGGDSGIAFYSGGALYLEGLIVRGYRQAGQADIDFQPVTGAKLSLKDSRVQSGATGLRIANTGGEVGVTVDSTRFENNGTGIAVTANGVVALRNSIVIDGAGDGVDVAGGNGQPLTATLARTLVSGNGAGGIVSSGTLPVYVTIDRATVRGNTGTGVYAAGGGSPSVTRLTKSTITRNATGIGVGAGGSIGWTRLRPRRCRSRCG